MKKAILPVLVFVLFPVCTTMAVEDTWTTKADMPTARGYFSTAVVKGKIYAFGGALGPNSGTSVVEEYNPATQVILDGTTCGKLRSSRSLTLTAMKSLTLEICAPLSTTGVKTTLCVTSGQCHGVTASSMLRI
jgi:hypothetical protein